MVNLTDFKNYWNGMPEKVTTLKSVHFVTDEGEIQGLLNDLTRREQPFAIVVIPSAKSAGSTQDNFQEENDTLLYVLEKEDAGNKSTFEVQVDTQPVMEAIKTQMIADKTECGIMRNLDLGSFQTDPEKKKFSVCTGWSLSFSFGDVN